MVILQLYRAGMTPAGDGEGAGAGPPEWIPVELEILTKLWLPDTEILRLKGFHRLSVLDRLQVRRGGKMLLYYRGSPKEWAPCCENFAGKAG